MTVRSINPKGERGKYPKVAEKQGKSPPQHPDFDEETGEGNRDPYAHWGE